MKLIDLVQAREVIKRFGDERLSTNLAYKMMKFIKDTDAEEAFYNEKVRDIVDRYGLRDEQGGFVIKGGNLLFDPSKAADGQREMAELDSVKVDSCNTKFSIDELAELKLSMNELMKLAAIIAN